MSLLQRIARRDFTVGVIGLGYVGLPLAVEYARKGISTVGVDVDSRKIESLLAGRNYIQDIDDAHVAETVATGTLRSSTDFSALADCDILFICVPTPFTDNKDPDISFIIGATEEMGKHMKSGACVILKSTTFPTTTEKYVQPILERDGRTVGSDFYLAFSPERIDPGNQTWHTANTPIVVGGVTPDCTAIAAAASRAIIAQVIEVSSPRVAEMEKLLENIFRSVNIALVNELAQLCDRMGGVNMWEVVQAAATKPFGFMPFWPGPGIGGHCILIDPYYLSWLAREHDFVTNFITLAAEVNESMPFYVQKMVLDRLAHLPISISDASIVVLGVAFKRDVDDLRHSPALKVMELLHRSGADNLSYVDPFIPEIEVDGRTFKSQESIDKAVRDADIVLITTDHTAFDYNQIVADAKVVIDTRNATRDVTTGREKIHLLGSGR